MSVFRPKRKVTAPDGCEWEIYVSRVPLPAWRPARNSTFDLTGMPVDYLFLLLEIPRFLFNQILLRSRVSPSTCRRRRFAAGAPKP